MKGKKSKKIRLGLSYFLIVPLLFISSCNKENPNLSDNYFVRFNAGNTFINYTVSGSQTISFQQINDQYSAFITGFDANSGITLQMYDDENIKLKTYANYGFVNGKIKGAVMGYNDKDDIKYSQYFPNTDVAITIEKITDNSVEGRFSGTLKSDEKGDISITNGEFLVQRFN